MSFNPWTTWKGLAGADAFRWRANAYVSAERALLCVDSEGNTADGELIDGCSKLIPLSGGSAMIAHRGSITFFSHLVRFAVLIPSFDALLRVLTSDAMIKIRDDYVKAMKISGTSDPTLDHGLQLLAVGYSAAAGRIIGRTVMSDSAGGFTGREEDGSYLLSADIEGLEIPETPEAMLRVARAQSQYIKRELRGRRAAGA